MEAFKKTVPIPLKAFLKSAYFRIVCLINRIFLRSLIKKNPRLHIGCGFKRLPACINADIKPTQATDVICDCSGLKIFPNNSIAVIYSHAFLEHLYYEQRQIHLKNAYRILKNRGVALYLGVPDFRAIARAYLDKKAGITFRNFDIDEVYRYTHGLTEEVPRQDWMCQLHKTIFDTETLKKLVSRAGFKSFCIFRYAFGKEKLSINLGFIAYKGKPTVKFEKREIEQFIRRFTSDLKQGTLLVLEKRNG